MNVPQEILKAGAEFGAGNYRQALAQYDSIIRFMLFKTCLPINDSQVQTIQAKRFACFREISG